MEEQKLTNAEAALLGLLSEQSMHPYQIEQEVKHRDMRFWTELSMSSIYKLLRKLEKEGLVIKKEEKSPENRLRKLYSLSESGSRKLKSTLKALLTEPEHMRWQVDIGIYNSGVLTHAEIEEALNEYKRALREKISGYHEMHKYLKDSNCPLRHQALAVRPVYLLEAEINWINAFLKQYK